MNKLSIALIMSTNLSIPSTTVYAEETNLNVQQLKNDPEVEDIMAFQNQVKDEIGAVYFEHTGAHLENPASRINLEEAYKVYIDDYFFEEISESKSVEERLADAPVIWYYEIPIDESLYFVEISKGNPIDESIEWTTQELYYLKSIENKWHISGVGYSTEPTFTVEETLGAVDTSEMSIEEDVYLVGGMKLINFPAAILTENQEPQAIVPLSELAIEGTPEEMEAVLLSPADSEVEVYDFEIPQSSIVNTEVSDNVGGSVIDLSMQYEEESLSALYISGAALLIGTGLIILKKKSPN